jgi:hypothetical protein
MYTKFQSENPNGRNQLRNNSINTKAFPNMVMNLQAQYIAGNLLMQFSITWNSPKRS